MLIYHTTLPQTNQLALFFLSASKAWRGLVTRQLHRTKRRHAIEVEHGQRLPEGLHRQVDQTKGPKQPSPYEAPPPPARLAGEEGRAVEAAAE